MKRALAIPALAAIGALAAIVPASPSGAQSAGDDITLIYGIRAVASDVYIDGDLTIAGVDYKSQTDLPLDESGNILFCVAQANPPATTTDCGGEANQVIPATTFNNMAGDQSWTVVAGFRPSTTPGDPLPEPALLDFLDDTTCSRTDARVSLYHAAAGDPVDSVDAFAGAFQYASDINHDEQESSEHPAPVQDVTIAVREAGNGNPVYSSDNGDGAQQTAANVNTITVLTGQGTPDNPYDVIYRRINNDTCPTTTSTTATTTVTPVAVTPRFTG